MPLCVYKPISKTPLEICKEIKEKRKDIKKISYAGRLDPMAHGLLLLLINEECLKQNIIHNYNKVYIFEVLIGISTDTYDTLGLINSCINFKTNDNHIKNIIEKFSGNFNQQYPPYSSIRVNGKPLWYYYKNNLNNNIVIPEKNISIKLSYLDKRIIDHQNIKNYVINNIKKVKGDFRQNEIIKSWENIETNNYTILRFQANVSAGTYIRSICNDIGKYLSCGACAYDIYRLKVGDYTLK